MELSGVSIGFAITGSHCTFSKVMPQLEGLVETGAEVIPIMSEPALNSDTKFGLASKWVNKVENITGKSIIDSIVKAEPIGPSGLLDLLIVAPCTGNTTAKIAHGIIDETVVMAVKAQLRNDRPALLAIATNDGLGLNGKNIGLLMNTDNIFFVPFGQDNPTKKQNSLVARMDLIKSAAEKALHRQQLQPVIIEYSGL
jgi:dipicolinate synthase subunit B